MNVISRVVFPCDLPQWPDVKKLIGELLTTRSLDCLLDTLQQMYNAVHCTSQPSPFVGPEVSARPKIKNVFAGLKEFLDKQASVGEFDEFFDRIIPYVVKQAIDIENLKSDWLHCKAACKFCDCLFFQIDFIIVS